MLNGLTILLPSPLFNFDHVCSYFPKPFSLEWWSFELLILLSGLLPNPELEASVLSIWYGTTVHKLTYIVNIDGSLLNYTWSRLCLRSIYYYLCPQSHLLNYTIHHTDGYWSCSKVRATTRLVTIENLLFIIFLFFSSPSIDTKT